AGARPMPKPPTAADKRVLRSLLKRRAPDLLPLLPPYLVPDKRRRATAGVPPLLASRGLLLHNTARPAGRTRGRAVRVRVRGGVRLVGWWGGCGHSTRRDNLHPLGAPARRPPPPG